MKNADQASQKKRVKHPAQVPARVAVITGGSSGIGAAVCRQLCDAGWKVYALSRRQGSDTPGNFLPCDVTDFNQISATLDLIASKEGHIDLVCANAGMGISGPIVQTEPQAARHQMDVNFFGAFFTAKAAVSHLCQSKGCLVFTSSVAGVLPVPFQAFYSASKAAVNSLSLTLANEVRPLGVRVTAVLPGDVHTNFTAAREKSPVTGIYQERVARSVAGMEKDEQNGMTPDQVARVIVRVAGKRHPRPYYVVGAAYHVFCLLGKFLPLRTVNALIGKLYG